MSKPPLLPLPVTGSLGVIATDYVGALPPSLNGNKYSSVIGDLYTNFIEALVSTIQTKIVPQLFKETIIFHHGTPQKFITDSGTNFTANLMKEECRMLNIHKVYTSSYYPQSGGFVERVNGIILQSIAMYVSFCQVD